MGDENKIEILFKTTADPSGAKQADQEIRKVNDAAKQSKPAFNEAADGAEKLNVKKKELLGNVKELSKHIPGLGNVITLLKNPYVGLAVGIGMAADKIREYFDRVNKAVENQNLEESLRRQAAAVGVIRAEIAAANMDFAEKLAEAGAKGQNAEANFRKVADQMERILSLQDKLTDATLANEKAQIKLLEAQKRITPEQAIQLTAAAEKRAEDRKQKDVASAAGNRQWLLLGAIMRSGQEEEAALAGGPTDKEIEAARQRENLANQAAENLGGYLNKKEMDLRREVTDLAAEEKTKGWARSKRKGANGLPLLKSDVEDELEQTVKSQEMLKVNAANAKLDRDRIEKQRAAAEQKGIEARQRRAQLQAELATLQERAAQEAPYNAQIQAQQAGAASATAQAQTITDKNHLASEIQAERRSYEGQVNSAVRSGADLPDVPPELKALIDRANSVIGNVGSVAAEFQRLDQQVQALARQVNTNATRQQYGPTAD